MGERACVHALVVVGGWHNDVGETHGENGVALTLLGKGKVGVSCLLCLGTMICSPNQAGLNIHINLVMVVIITAI
jgi:hypothetical protein